MSGFTILRLPDWWWRFKKEQTFGVRLRSIESGYAD
jgi:hypothetical protein